MDNLIKDNAIVCDSGVPSYTIKVDGVWRDAGAKGVQSGGCQPDSKIDFGDPFVELGGCRITGTDNSQVSSSPEAVGEIEGAESESNGGIWRGGAEGAEGASHLSQLCICCRLIASSKLGSGHSLPQMILSATGFQTTTMGSTSNPLSSRMAAWAPIPSVASVPFTVLGELSKAMSAILTNALGSIPMSTTPMMLTAESGAMDM